MLHICLLCAIKNYLLIQHKLLHGYVGTKGGATVLKVGDNFASKASEKYFLPPPLPYPLAGFKGPYF